MADDLKRFQRNMTTARRELRRAVERAAAVDLRPGHYAEARRLAEQTRDAADKLVSDLEGRS